MRKTIYHAVYGATDMYEVDARTALKNFPGEWSEKEWSEAETKAARAKAVKDAHQALIDAGKAMDDARTDSARADAARAKDAAERIIDQFGKDVRNDPVSPAEVKGKAEDGKVASKG